MNKYIKINEETKTDYNKQIKNYLNPDYLYIPYNDGDKINVKTNEEILKNSILLVNSDKFVYSPISGKVLGLCENIINGKKGNTIVIENDFKENSTTLNTNKNRKLSKDELVDKIRKYSSIKGRFNNKVLIINGMDFEPYERNISYLIREHTESILETIDLLINTLKIEKCFFAIKNDDSLNVETLVNQIGMYPNINLRFMPNLYPLAYKDLLIKEFSYRNKDVLYLTAEDIYTIYNLLKKDSPMTEKLVTITGNLLNKSKIVNVKLGTRISDIIQNEFKIAKKEYHVVINGLLSGYEIDNLNAVITPSIRSIFISSPDLCKTKECINCGLCHLKCPMKCDPRTKYQMDKCINCGLCNYVCPSKIKLIGAKNE